MEQLHTVLGKLTDESAALADKLRLSLEEGTDDTLQHVQLLEQAASSVQASHTSLHKEIGEVALA